MPQHSILMLEYDDDDRYITVQYFQNFHPSIALEIVNSSEEVMKYLRESIEGKRELPSVLLLNYNSTPLSAPELLTKLKENVYLKHIPVVVLSGVLAPGIVRECYSKGASSFIQKPVSTEATNKKIGSFIDYWFKTVELI